MVNATENRKAVGNVLLALDIDRFRQPTFLRRNLAQALEYHESERRGEFSRVQEEMAANAQSADCWKPPSKKVLQKLWQKKRPVLRIDVKALRPTKRGAAEDVGQARKRSKVEIDCTVEVLIWPQDRTNGSSCRVNKPATLQARHSTESTSPEFEIYMDEPIEIDSSQLGTPIGSDMNWKRSLGTRYDLHVWINFQSPKDVSTVLQLLGKQQTTGSFLKKTRLLVKWTHLPECPSNNQLLPVSISKGEDREKLSYGMQVHMAWKGRKDSILKTHNLALRAREGGPTSRSLPMNTRITTNGHDETHEQIAVNGEGGKALAAKATLGFFFPTHKACVALHGFVCPFCVRKKFTSCELLHLHLNTLHEQYNFKSLKGDKEGYAEMKLDYVFEAALSKSFTEDRPLYTYNRADYAIKWIAPQRPFDIQKWLAGEDDWIKGASVADLQNAQSRSTRTAILPSSMQVKPSGEVLDLPTRVKKTCMVPQVPPSVKLFRLSSKRPLEEGEELSESDDDIEFGWINAKRNLARQNTGLSETAKQFAQMMDDYLEDTESVSGDVYMGDTLIRFVRTKGSALQIQGLRKEFEIKLRELVARRVVGEEILRQCISFLDNELHGPANHNANINGVEPSTPTRSRNSGRREALANGEEDGGLSSAERTPRRSKRTPKVSSRAGRSQRVDDDVGKEPGMGDGTQSGKGQTERNATASQMRPAVAAGEVPPVSLACVCGKEVLTMRGALQCSNPGCLQPDYHMECVGVFSHSTTWICPRCVVEST
ncbi:hypothetical protein NA57DRAFT_77679 [Rhizodiscina lignyota]|uniref:Polycomb protein VEFS-Box domain-containing protein n=1 Tax=Rhizodiscina lignyota TaxID=1504668 RepID=A0A9P4M469_9PEZI|nr:hypothetical protein NA57DRAFT_77679 [Rhizodiscina lignyota]